MTGLTSDLLKEHQNIAYSALTSWFFAGDFDVAPTFTLFGKAGSGKTHLLSVLDKELTGNKKLNICYATYTGKAASVMRERGIDDATTIHSLIYRPVYDPVTEETTFELDEDSPAASADLIVIDEVSMVDEKLGQDLMSFGVPILVVGDMVRQLPPIGDGQSYFYTEQPDADLLEIIRNAKDSPIPHVADAVFNNPAVDLRQFKHDCFNALNTRKMDDRILMAADQVLCGTNKTRVRINKRINQIRGEHIYPEIDSRVIVLRNDHDRDLMNGEQGVVQKIHKMSVDDNIGYLEDLVDKEARNRTAIKKALKFFKSGHDISPRFWLSEVKKEGAESGQWVPMSLADFENDHYGNGAHSDEVKRADKALAMALAPIRATWAYCSSTHKAQGSEFKKVVAIDDGFGTWGPDDGTNLRARWLYTLITRSSERLAFFGNRY